MEVVGFAILVVGLAWGGIYLIMNSQACWGALLLLMVAGARYRSTNDVKELSDE